MTYLGILGFIFFLFRVWPTIFPLLSSPLSPDPLIPIRAAACEKLDRVSVEYLFHPTVWEALEITSESLRGATQ